MNKSLYNNNCIELNPIDLLFNKLNIKTTYSYSLILLYVHHKGNNDSLILNSQDQKKQTFCLTTFNKLYSTIAKRKSHQADNSLFKFDTCANGVALVISNKKTRALFYLSNNTFLPVSNTEANKTATEIKKIRNNIFFYINNITQTIDNRLYKSFINNSTKNKNKNLSTVNDSSITDIYQFYKYDILGQLLNTLKHELSNPLFGINALSQIMHFADLEINQFVKQIEIKSSQAISIISNCNDYYNQTSTIFNLNKTLKQTLIILKSLLRDVIIKQEIKVDKNLEIKNNKTWFIQVLTNLLINAGEVLKISKDKKIFLNIFLVNSILTIEVHDNGLGVAEEIIKKIFVNNFTTKKNGNGIGLYISKILATKMKGNLQYKKSNIKNYTSNFTFTLSYK